MKLTHAQERELQRLSAPLGITPVRFMVEAALGRGGLSPSQVRVLSGEFLRAKRVLDNLGNNLNQLTEYSHADRRLQPGVVGLLPEIERAVVVLREAVEGLMPRWS